MTAVTSTAWTTDVWYTMRATGVVALVLLSLTVVLGILTAGRVRTRSWPAFAQAELHKRISLLAMVFLAIHVVTAVLDSYVDVGWVAVLVPFASPYRPLWTGLGTVSVDLLVAVAVSSALRQRIAPRTWRGIHWLAYGSWPVAMAHSLGMGTDASQLWMDAVAGLCSAGVLVALGWRLGDRRAARIEAERVGARAEELAQLGLLIEPFGPGAVLVRETPALLGETDVAGLVRDIADDLAENVPNHGPAAAKPEGDDQRHGRGGGKKERQIFRRLPELIDVMGEENVEGQKPDIEDGEQLNPKLGLIPPTLIWSGHVPSEARPPWSSVEPFSPASGNCHATARNPRHP